MSELITNALKERLIIVWIIIFSFDALFNGIVLSLSNIDWSTLSPTHKFVLVCMIGKTWCAAMVALFTQAIQRVEKGQNIIPTGDTIMITKDQVEGQQQSTTNKGPY